MQPSQVRILIADDHVGLCRGVRSFLEANKAWEVVEEAYDGHEALRIARETRPHVAILDYSLPQMNGLELTRIIKQELPDTEILIFTMHERENIIVDVLRAGARGYVLKTDSIEHLLAAVEALSRHKPYFSSAISEALLGTYIEGSHSSSNKHALTTRERELVQLIAEGQSNKQAANIMGISVKTVETHRSAAMHKLKLTTTADLVLYAVRNDIVLP